MKKFSIIMIAALLITLCSCSERTNNKLNYSVVGSNVTILGDSTGKNNIVLAFEVSNVTNKPLYFKESDFDIIDENGKLIDTMKAVSAYPPVVDPDKTAVYYDVKIFNKVPDKNVKLKAIPHINSDKSHVKQAKLSIKGITGWRKKNPIGIVENNSSRTEYKNVHIAIISKTHSKEVVSVMTATIDLMKPGEQVEFEAKRRVKGRELGPNEPVSISNFVYVDPEELQEIGEGSIMFKIVTLAFLLLIFGGVIWLQIFLSKKGNKWLGLILPTISFVFSLISTVSIFLMFKEIGFIPRHYEEFDKYGNLISTSNIEPGLSIGDVIFMTFMTFLIYNILTLIFMGIYWICRKRQLKHIAEENETV